jgi:hypothetical protein
MSKRETSLEKVSFSIPASQAKRIREHEGREPAELAEHYLMNLYEDRRRTLVKLKTISVGWLPEVYHALVKHVGRGGVSNYIRDSFYSAMIGDGHELIPPPILKEGHVRTSGQRKKADVPVAQPNRQSVVVPLVLPEQWHVVGSEAHPGKLSTFIKAVTQMRLQKETKKTLPVQKGLGVWLNQ